MKQEGYSGTILDSIDYHREIYWETQLAYLMHLSLYTDQGPQNICALVMKSTLRQAHWLIATLTRGGGFRIMWYGIFKCIGSKTVLLGVPSYFLFLAEEQQIMMSGQTILPWGT